MTIQVDPLNGFQRRVAQKTLQMVPHERCSSRLHSEGERSVRTQHIQILCTDRCCPTKYLHRFAHARRAAEEMQEWMRVSLRLMRVNRCSSVVDCHKSKPH